MSNERTFSGGWSTVNTDLQTPEQAITSFVRFDLTASLGTFRYVIDGPAQTANIDGTGVQSWSRADGMLGPMPQSQSSIMTVSWISMVNLDYTWANWANTNGAHSLRGSIVQVYREHFNPATGTLLGYYKVYQGIVDDSQSGPRIALTLKPQGIGFSTAVPNRVAGPACLQEFKDEYCQYAGADVTCLKTRAACILKGNQAHLLIADHMPQQGVPIYSGTPTAAVQY